VGTIAVDDVIDIVQEEASEDIFRMRLGPAELEPPLARSGRHAAPAWCSDCSIEMMAGWSFTLRQDLGKVILLASLCRDPGDLGHTGLQSVT